MLPSKNILVALALLLVGLGGLTWYGYSRGSNTYYANTASNQNLLAVASSSSPDAALSQKDSDGDGLPDWEEALYGTDPHNPDTDGDGTRDGAEVAMGRNPLVKGPNDYLVSKDNPVATSTPKEKLTLTDTFARDFFTEYMNLQQSGTQVTSDNADQIASDYLAKTPLPTITAKQYTAGDLPLTDSDQAHLTKYRDTITTIFSENWPSGSANELSVLQEAFTNNDTNALAGLTPIIADYQAILRNALGLSVPKLAVSLHLNLVNSLSTYIQTLKMIQVAYTDPLSGLVGLNAYQTNQANVLVSAANLRVYFINSLP